MAEADDDEHVHKEEEAEVIEPVEAETTNGSTEKPEVPKTIVKPKPHKGDATAPNKFKRLLSTYWAKKKLTLPLTVLALLLVIFAIPVTRYDTLGLFLKKSVTVNVVDSKTDAPVSAAQVTLAGKTFNTNSSGKASQKLKLGSSTLAVSKHYYQSTSKNVMVTL